MDSASVENGQYTKIPEQLSSSDIGCVMLALGARLKKSRRIWLFMEA